MQAEAALQAHPPQAPKARLGRRALEVPRPIMLLEEPALPEAPEVPEAQVELEAHIAKKGRRVTFDPNLPNDDEERANRARLRSRWTRAERQDYQDYLQFRDRMHQFMENIGNRFRQILVIKALLFLFTYDQEEVYFVARQGPAMEGGMEVAMEPVRKRWATRVFIFVAITYIILAVVTIGHFKVCLPEPKCPLPSCDEYEEWARSERSRNPLVDMRCLVVWFGFTPRDGWFPRTSPVPGYSDQTSTALMTVSTAKGSSTTMARTSPLSTSTTRGSASKTTTALTTLSTTKATPKKTPVPGICTLPASTTEKSSSEKVTTRHTPAQVLPSTKATILTPPPTEPTVPPSISTAPPLLSSTKATILTRPPTESTVPPSLSTAPPLLPSTKATLLTTPPTELTVPPSISTAPPLLPSTKATILTPPPIPTSPTSMSTLPVPMTATSKASSVSVPVSTTSKATPVPAPMSVTSKATPVPTPMSTTSKSTPVTGDSERLLFCIVGSSLRDNTFPPDGICSVLAYGVLSSSPKGGDFENSNSIPSFLLFLEKIESGTFKKTKTGLAINSAMKSSYENTNAVKFLTRYTNLGVTYIGTVHVPNFASFASASRMFFKFTTEFFEDLVKTNAMTPLSYFVGLLPSVTDPSAWVKTAMEIENDMKQKMLFFIETYEDKRGEGSPCFVGGTAWLMPSDCGRPSLKACMDYANEVKFSHDSISVPAVTVASAVYERVSVQSAPNLIQPLSSLRKPKNTVSNIQARGNVCEATGWTNQGVDSMFHLEFWTKLPKSRKPKGGKAKYAIMESPSTIKKKVSACGSHGGVAIVHADLDINCDNEYWQLLKIIKQECQSGK